MEDFYPSEKVDATASELMPEINSMDKLLDDPAYDETIRYTNLLFPEAVVSCTDSDNDGFSIEGGICGVVDCNDNDANVNPGAVEVCGNAIDENCDGIVESCAIEDDTTAPGSVTNLRETNVTVDSILWNWTNPTDADFDFNYIDMLAEGISKADLEKSAGVPVNTVPQIFIDQKHLGGCSEFEQYAKENLGLYA